MSVTVVQWPAEVDAAVAPGLEQTVRLSLADAGPAGELLMDLSDVVFVDSSGLRVLVIAQNLADLAGVRLTVRASDRVRKILRITAMTDLFHLEQDSTP